MASSDTYSLTMKNRIITSVCCAVAALLCAVSALAQSDLRPRGDVNGDWLVTVADATRVVAFILGDETSVDRYYADVNGDGVVTIADANMIIAAIMGAELPPMPGYSGTLPVLYVNTRDGRPVTSVTESVPGTYWLDPKGTPGCEAVGSREAPLPLQVRGRGNYTWIAHDKKPYKLRLDQKQSLLGMPRNRHYALLACAGNGMSEFLKNAVGFEASRRVGLAFTPRQQPVELVLNGEYRGLYLLTETVRVGKNRVNITEQPNGATDPATVAGGWLVEIDNTTAANTLLVHEQGSTANIDNWLRITPHAPDSLSAEQKNYLTAAFTAINAAVYGTDTAACLWQRFVDLDTLACFYVMNELVDEVESFRGSCYLHKQAGDSAKWMFGPAWDFGSAVWRDNPQSYLYQSVRKNHWIERMWQAPQFQACVRRHWQRLQAAGLTDLDDVVAVWVERLTAACAADQARWPAYYWQTRDQELTQFTTRLHIKRAWLQTQWGATP